VADTLTTDDIAMIRATVARVHAERADAGTMAARYDAACERIVELLDETIRQRRQIDALTDELADAREALAAATWPARAARRLADDAHPTTERSDR
jgi:multidrug resistance efflux pump